MLNRNVRNLSAYSPQSNLPCTFVSYKGENKLLGVFIKILKQEKSSLNRKRFLGKELNMNGYGIADLVLSEFNHFDKSRKIMLYPSITAFELKLNNIPKGIRQAYRYKYFAHKSILVLPRESYSKVENRIDELKDFRIGLWLVDTDSLFINKIYTPKRENPFSEKAYNKVKNILVSKVRQAS
jgi:hypothetical protein